MLIESLMYVLSDIGISFARSGFLLYADCVLRFQGIQSLFSLQSTSHIVYFSSITSSTIALEFAVIIGSY